VNKRAGERKFRELRGNCRWSKMGRKEKQQAHNAKRGKDRTIGKNRSQGKKKKKGGGINLGGGIRGGNKKKRGNLPEEKEEGQITKKDCVH